MNFEHFLQLRPKEVTQPYQRYLQTSNNYKRFK
jgi:hypothetical protein